MSSSANGAEPTVSPQSSEQLTATLQAVSTRLAELIPAMSSSNQKQDILAQNVKTFEENARGALDSLTVSQKDLTDKVTAEVLAI